jgi:hypothetical protein
VLFSQTLPDTDGGPTGRPSPYEPSPTMDHAEPDQASELAYAIHRAGMSGVASIALQILKPLHWMGGQALWAFQPFIDGLRLGNRPGPVSIGGIARLLEREDSVDSLLTRLDEIQSQPGDHPEPHTPRGRKGAK